MKKALKNYRNTSFESKPWAPRPMHDASSHGTSSAGYKGKKNFINDVKNRAEFAYAYNAIHTLSPAPLCFTENGALEYATTGKALLDIHYQISSLRNKDEKEIISMWRKAFNENPRLAIRWLLMIADIREGEGERRTFQIIIKDIASNGGDWMVANLVSIIPEFTRWDMIYTLLEVKSGRLYNAVKFLIVKQWNEDMRNMKQNKPISLMAKWLKSANSHNPETRKWGLKTATMLALSERDYRKSLSAMRDYLEVVETRMSSNNWQAIDYEKVPSKANLIYRNAFLRNDEERRRLYLEALQNGEAKINSNVVFPHEIVHKYFRGDSITALEAMWRSLPNMIPDGKNTLVVCDDSGSMNSFIDNKSSVSAKEVAFALSIYFAEKNKGPFHNYVMTFSRKPFLRRISGTTLREKIGKMLDHSEVANTNIEAVFDLILSTAMVDRYSQADMPDNILILTDGEWDDMVDKSYTYNKPMFFAIRDRYERAGYKMPKLIFWNLCNRSGSFPFHENDNFPCTLVSGFSVNTFKMVLSDKTNPWEVLVEELSSKRYELVEKMAFSSPTSNPATTQNNQNKNRGSYGKSYNKTSKQTQYKGKSQDKKKGRRVHVKKV